jgi:hypothetical protein
VGPNAVGRRDGGSTGGPSSPPGGALGGRGVNREFDMACLRSSVL